MRLGVPSILKKTSLVNNQSNYNAVQSDVLMKQRSLESDQQQYHLPVSISSKSRLFQQPTQQISSVNFQIKLQKAQMQPQNNYDSLQSSCSVQLTKEAKQKDIDQQKVSILNIKQKLQQITKSMKLNDDQSMQRRSEVEIEGAQNSIVSTRKQPQRELSKDDKEKSNISQIPNPCNVNIGEERKLFDVMNERFKKIKEIHNRGGLQTQNKQIEKQAAKEKVSSTYQQNLPSFAQQCTQTQDDQYENEVQSQTERKSLKQSYNKLNTINNQLQLQNQFLKNKINLLRKNLQKYQTELIESKLLQKDKTNYFSQGKTFQWRFKQQIYLNRIAILQKQLNKVSYPKKQSNYNSFSEIGEIKSPKIAKNSEEYYDHLQKIKRYEKYLQKSMQSVKKQQQKIMNEWRVIQAFHQGTKMSIKKQVHFQ